MSATPKHRRRKEARPGELLAAALAVFAERGYAATKMDEVARRAGVTKGTIYLYFPTKEELFRAMVREAVVPNLGAIEALAHDRTVPATDLLRQVITRATALVVTTPVGRLPKLILAEAGNFPEIARFWAEEVIARGRRLLAAIVAYGVETGEFAPLAPEATLLLFSPVLMVALWNASIAPVIGAPLDAEAMARHAADLVLDGLRRRKEPS